MRVSCPNTANTRQQAPPSKVPRRPCGGCVVRSFISIIVAVSLFPESVCEGFFVKKHLQNYASSTSSHLHLHNHVLTSISAHLHFTSSHLHLSSSSSSHIYISAHLHILTSTSQLIFIFTHLHLCSSSHLHIYISAHLHILISNHIYNLHLTSSPLAFQGQCRRTGTLVCVAQLQCAEQSVELEAENWRLSEYNLSARSIAGAGS